MMNEFLERGGAWVIGQGVLMLAVFALGLTYRGNLHSAALGVLGTVLLLAGAAVGLAGAISLGTNLTPFPKPSIEVRLVRHGIYAWIRHPLYTSVMLAASGWALSCRSWPALIAALAMLPFFTAKARVEERWLQRRFSNYSDYQRHTWRFVPWVY